MVKQADFKAAFRLKPEALRGFVTALFEAAGCTAAGAQLVAELLVDNDLHGASSHGTNLPHAWGYLRGFREGTLNPRPQPHVVADEGSCRVYDGDGGIGHPVCFEAMQWAIAKAKETGCAVATTRNHHHFGAAVQWSRMAMKEGCIAIACSSHRYQMDPNSSIRKVNGTSPISIAIPGAEQAPVALDMGASFGLPNHDEFFDMMPGAYFKEVALGAITYALGGVVSGIYRDEVVHSRWSGSNQGSFLVVIDAGRLQPLAELKAQMDRFVRDAERMRPMPGHQQAHLPGGREMACFRECVMLP
jgi:LDH2 family malate/lactate/ureidoglycolate dehydrogenase